MTAAVVAVDVGGTTLKGAAFRPDGSPVTVTTVPTFFPGEPVTARLPALVESLIDTCAAGGLRVEGIGIGSPGLVDSRAGVIRFAANVGLSGFPVVDVLQARFGLPVRVDHDARVAAVAERAAIGADGVDDLLFIPIGTGIAAAVVVNGMLVRGATGGAGEFGHMPVVPGGDRCGCGQRGCIEAYASGGALLRRYRARGRAARSAAEIVARVGSDPDAALVWREAVDALATGVVGLTAALDPAAVVLGGGISQAGSTLLDPLRDAVAARLTWRTVPQIRLSRLGSRAGLIGAGLLGGHLVPDPARFALAAADALERATSTPPLQEELR